MDACQKTAYEYGREVERKRWAQNLRRWLKKDSGDHTLRPCIWIDSILEKIQELAKSPRKKRG